jgi:hypothetical protein
LDGVSNSDVMFNEKLNFVSTMRIGIDPETGMDLESGKTYYIKTRSFHNFTNVNDYYENPIIHPFTPYKGHNSDRNMHPFWYGATLKVSANTWMVQLNWMNVPSPLTVHNSPSYEIYRLNSENDLTRDNTTLLFYTNTASVILHNNKFKNIVTAAGGRTLSFNAASKAISASTGSYLTDGYTIGDVIIVTGTSSNNGYFSILSVAATVMTVRETLVNEGPLNSIANISGKPPISGQTYYYVLRKYNSAGVFTESLPQRIITPNYNPKYPLWLGLNPGGLGTTTNLCFQSNTMNTSWAGTGTTRTNAALLSPIDVITTSAANRTATSIAFTHNDGYVRTGVTTAIGNNYVYSVYLRSNDVTGNTIILRNGTNNLSCSLTQKWQRFSVSFTATTTLTTIGIFGTTSTNGKTIFASLNQYELNNFGQK